MPLRRNVIEAETPISDLVRDAAHGWMLPVLDLDPVIAPTAAVGALAMLRDQTFKPHAACRLEQNLALLEWRHEDPLGPPVGADNFLNFPRHIAKVQPLRAIHVWDSGFAVLYRSGPANCRSGQPPTTPSRCSLLAVTAGLQMIAHHGLRLAQPASIMIVMRWIGYTVLVDKTRHIPSRLRDGTLQPSPPHRPHARRPPATSGEPKLHRLGPVDVGQQSVTATSDLRAGPRRVAATHLSRVSPSGTRSRSGGAPLPRPAPWRAA